MALGRLVVYLTSNTRGYTRGMKGARNTTSSFVSFAKRGLATLGIAFVAAKMIGAARRSLAELDATAKLADRTGFGTKNLAALGFAAEQTGTSQQILNKSLETMNKRMGEAKAGLGSALPFLNQLGISQDALARSSPDQLFDKIARGIRALPGPLEQAAAANAVFGRQGQQMLNLLTSDIDAFKREAASLGLGFDREELRKVEEANDAMNRVKRSVGALFDSIIVKAAPSIQTITDALGSAIGWLRSTGSAIQTHLAEGIDVAMAIGEFAFQNWRPLAELAIKSVLLTFVGFGNDVAFFFTTQLPALFAWFGRNWRDVFTTALNFTKTIFTNLVSNVKNAMSEIWAFIKSGGTKSLELSWKPLTKGAINTIKELPDIPKRAFTQIEKQLLGDVDRLGKQLKGGIEKSIRDRLATVRSAAANAAEAKRRADAEREQKKSQTEQFGSRTGNEPKFVSSGLGRNSAKAFEQILKSTSQSRGEDPAVREQRETNTRLDKVVDATERTARVLDDLEAQGAFQGAG